METESFLMPFQQMLLKPALKVTCLRLASATKLPKTSAVEGNGLTGSTLDNIDDHVAWRSHHMAKYYLQLHKSLLHEWPNPLPKQLLTTRSLISSLALNRPFQRNWLPGLPSPYPLQDSLLGNINLTNCSHRAARSFTRIGQEWDWDWV